MMMDRYLKIALLAALVAGCPARDKSRQAGEAKARTQMSPVGPLGVHQIKVNLRIPPVAKITGLTVASVQARVKKKIGSAPVMTMTANKGADTYRLWIQMGVGADPEQPAGEGLVLLCSARAEMLGAVDGVVLQASAVAPLGQKGGHATRAWTTLDTVLGDILFQAGLARAPVARLVKALAVKDPRRLEAAMDIVAVRRAGEALEPVARLLKHKDPRISDRAIGALVSMGNPAAVKHLTRMTKFSDTERMAKVLDAIGALGGKEARQYLEFVASGHEDEDIRNMAKEALDRMERAQKKKTRP